MIDEEISASGKFAEWKLATEQEEFEFGLALTNIAA